MTDASEPSKSIRPATAADAEVLGRFGTTLMALHHDWDAERFIAPKAGTEPAYAGFLEEQLNIKNVVILVVEVENVVLGYCYARLEGSDYMALRGPAGVIHDVFIAADRRREGFGRLVLEATLAELSHRGAKQVVLSTAHQNKAAQRLFAALGFRPTMIEMARTLGRGDTA